VEDFATHRIPIDEAPDFYERFQTREDGVVKVLIQP
jgi:threonine dehydrogenase-like Zn-dependent dehydrogenase